MKMPVDNGFVRESKRVDPDQRSGSQQSTATAFALPRSAFFGTNVRCRFKSLLDERAGLKAAAEPRVIYPVRRRFGQVTRARLN
jgi:hypothetical protein